jgi:DNA-directed RNA polymerase subunit B
MKASVFLNGRFVGFHDNGDALSRELREQRRKGEISWEANVAFYPKTNEVFINTDEGRARRPLIVVKNRKPALKEEHLQKVSEGSLKWRDLVQQGVIEYLDAEEEENARIALKEEEVEKETEDRFTHLEIDPANILGYASNQIPFPEYNSAHRVLMAAQHAKQGLGLYASNYNLRSDTRAHVLHYPQKPLVQTRVYSDLQNYKRASGANFVVAVLSYKGYNMNDAVVLNRSAVERGMARSSFIRTYTTEERRYPGGQKDKLEIPPDFVQGYLGPDAYASLDEDGLITPETVVNGDSVLVGKTSPPRFLKEVTALEVESERRRESSVTVRSNEAGIVDTVMLSETTASHKLIKVRVRRPCVPEIGDKFASRFGQKGVVALLANPEDLPFTKDGIVPDLIINPHAIPGRMTAGHLLEMLSGKAAALSGQGVDGSAFSWMNKNAKSGREDFEKVLKKHGFKYSGEEVLYDGETGRPMHAHIFMGVIYYQRLHHLVSLKLHARSRGPVQMLTHQPTEGRAREGGLRIGEMERDCFIGYGAAALLKERMIDSSDKTVELVCNACGSLAVHDKIKNKRYCPVCQGTDIDEVEMSYAFKLLLDEMKSIGIFPKLRTRERS